MAAIQSVLLMGLSLPSLLASKFRGSRAALGHLKLTAKE